MPFHYLPPNPQRPFLSSALTHHYFLIRPWRRKAELILARFPRAVGGLKTETTQSSTSVEPCCGVRFPRKSLKGDNRSGSAVHRARRKISSRKRKRTQEKCRNQPGPMRTRCGMLFLEIKITARLHAEDRSVFCSTASSAAPLPAVFINSDPLPAELYPVSRRFRFAAVGPRKGGDASSANQIKSLHPVPVSVTRTGALEVPRKVGPGGPRTCLPWPSGIELGFRRSSARPRPKRKCVKGSPFSRTFSSRSSCMVAPFPDLNHQVNFPL